MKFIRTLSALLILFLTFSAFSQTAQKSQKSEIFVLSTLHQYHGELKYYSFETLTLIIEKLRPDILAVELTAADLASRREQKTKQEYQKSIFPLIDKNKYTAIALEPDELKFSEIVSVMRESDKELREKAPEKAEGFSLYIKMLNDYLFKTWNSPLAVNSSQTDGFFEVKHDYQNELFGEKQRQGWERWNRHFLEVIFQTARKIRESASW